jgi:hypothetical protein
MYQMSFLFLKGVMSDIFSKNDCLGCILTKVNHDEENVI